ncbi:MAG: conjugal transfer protein TraN, partial [Methylovulum sp.]|nr:conjugal transfer protein TraN [Methylovulum sp.]
AKMVVQLIFACTEEETKLNMLKNQKLCTGPNEIGNYCSADFFGICVARREAYCCFSSPFARIFQQQARPQLGLTFGDPKAPTCDGLTINQIQTIDFNQMDFSEWIDMMKVSNIMPIDNATADQNYDKGNVTKGRLPGTQNTNTQQRLDDQIGDKDIDSICLIICSCTIHQPPITAISIGYTSSSRISPKKPGKWWQRVLRLIVQIEIFAFEPTLPQPTDRGGGRAP